MRITTQSPVTFSLAEMKGHLRVEHDLEDDVIARYLDAAVMFYENATGYYLRQTTFTARFTESPIQLVVRPWSKSFVVQAKTDENADITITRYEAPGEVSVIEWDSTSVGALNLTWRVGAPKRPDIPAMAAQAVRALVADMYVNRQMEQPVQLYKSGIASAMMMGEARTSL